MGKSVSDANHCFALRICGAMSSPTLQGKWNKTNLNRIAKNRKSFMGEIELNEFLQCILSITIVILKERYLKAIQLERSNKTIARAFWEEYKPSHSGDLLLNKHNSIARYNSQYPGINPMKRLSFKLNSYSLIFSQSGFWSAKSAISFRI